ncbi:radical SAM protein [Altererythrobacter confluentis]|uniref:Radical SAM protein n=1 Tax=Allopontixanthobacter confluentis TaxID=1849021 RepID=A0A6L7GGD7_9SPHN|nr:radical SAM protein [Allopontixanthobacter confluentis]MXP14967.1 radical SAM protein [Allopontixanthobacter confluentis]
MGRAGRTPAQGVQVNAPRSKSRNAPAGPSPFAVDAASLPRAKFSDPERTAKGEARAKVPLTWLDTLWFNTGTLCNLACATCYIESSPTNDALLFIRAADVAAYLDEIAATCLPVREIGFTGGEPFMNPDFIAMLTDALGRGHEALVLSNAMKPMRRYETQLLALLARHGARLTIRVSLDHHTSAVHEAERGRGSWDAALDGLRWLSANGFAIAVAGRMLPGEGEADERAGYAELFRSQGIGIDAADPAQLVLFPEMDEAKDIAEITTDCWQILGKSPADIMCATSRMVVHRKGEPAPRVAACTLIPYDHGFDMGATLADAALEVSLNHPHCARFCVLGGASCSA